jgi:hypothetical protein
MVLMSIAALLLVGTVNAAVKQGDMEVDALAGYTMMAGAEGNDDMSALFLMGRVGYFVTNEIQVAGVGMGAWISDGDDMNIYGIGVAGKYHFMVDKQWVPYVGAQILFGSADMGGGSANATIYGGLVGVRYEMTPVTDLFIEGQFNLFSGDIGDAFDNMWIVMAGFVHQWQ